MSTTTDYLALFSDVSTITYSTSTHNTTATTTRTVTRPPTATATVRLFSLELTDTANLVDGHTLGLKLDGYLEV